MPIELDSISLDDKLKEFTQSHAELRGLTYDQIKSASPEIADIFDRAQPDIEQNIRETHVSGIPQVDQDCVNRLWNFKWDVMEHLDQNPETRLALQKLQNPPTVEDLKERLNLNDLDKFRIYHGRETIYAENQGEVIADQLTPDTIDLVKNALDNPESLDGSIRLMQGNEKLLHIKDGEVLVDKLGLVNQVDMQQPMTEQHGAIGEVETEAQSNASPPSVPEGDTIEVSSARDELPNPHVSTLEGDTIEVNSARDELVDFPPEATNHLGLEDSVSAMQVQLEALKQQVQAQSARLEKLAGTAQSMAEKTANKGIKLAQSNPNVGSWLDRIKGKATEAFNMVSDRAKADLQSVKNAIAQPTASALMSAATKAAQWVGDDVNGSKILDSKNHRLQVDDDGKLQVRDRPQVQHDKLLETASKGVTEKGLKGVKQTIANAQKLGATDKDIRTAMSKHPTIERMGDKGNQAVAQLQKTVQRELNSQPKLKMLTAAKTSQVEA